MEQKDQIKIWDFEGVLNDTQNGLISVNSTTHSRRITSCCITKNEEILKTVQEIWVHECLVPHIIGVWIRNWGLDCGFVFRLPAEMQNCKPDPNFGAAQDVGASFESEAEKLGSGLQFCISVMDSKVKPLATSFICLFPLSVKYWTIFFSKISIK